MSNDASEIILIGLNDLGLQTILVIMIVVLLLFCGLFNLSHYFITSFNIQKIGVGRIVLLIEYCTWYYSVFQTLSYINNCKM